MSFMRNFWATDTVRDFLVRGAVGGGGVSTPATNGAVAKHAPGLANGALPVKPTVPAQSPPGSSASDQAQLTKRLGALVGPYKEALSKNATEAAQMQPLMVAVKQRIVERNYSAAGQALDDLEPLVEQYKGSQGNDKVHQGDVQAAVTKPEPALQAGAPQPFLIAIEIHNNRHSWTLALGGRLLLYAQGLYSQGPPQVLRWDLLSWSSDPPNTVVSIDEKGFASALEDGSAKVTVKEKESGKTSAAVTITVKLEVQPEGDSTVKQLKNKLPELVQIYDQAKFDYQTLLAKVRELDRARKAIPPENEIFQEISRNTKPETSSAAIAERTQNQVTKLFQNRMGDLATTMDLYFGLRDSVLKKMDAEKLLQNAQELREKAEKWKKQTEAVVSAVTNCLDLASALVAPEFLLVEQLVTLKASLDLANTFGKEFNVGIYGTIEEWQAKADEAEKKAHEINLEALKDDAQALEKAGNKAATKITEAINDVKEAAANLESIKKNVEKMYDNSRPTKSKFQFTLLRKPLELAGTIAMLVPQARKSAMDAFGAIKRVEKSHDLSLDAMSRDTLSWFGETKDIGQQIEIVREDLDNLRTTANETMASANDEGD